MEDKLNSIKSLKLNPNYKGEKEREPGANTDEAGEGKAPNEEEEEGDCDDLKDEEETNEDI